MSPVCSGQKVGSDTSEIMKVNAAAGMHATGYLCTNMALKRRFVFFVALFVQVPGRL
jgi:hypothetical protein